MIVKRRLKKGKKRLKKRLKKGVKKKSVSKELTIYDCEKCVHNITNTPNTKEQISF